MSDKVSVTMGHHKDGIYRITNAQSEHRAIKIHGKDLKEIYIAGGTIYGRSWAGVEPIGSVLEGYEYSHHDKYEVIFKPKEDVQGQ